MIHCKLFSRLISDQSREEFTVENESEKSKQWDFELLRFGFIEIHLNVDLSSSKAPRCIINVCLKMEK